MCLQLKPAVETCFAEQGTVERPTATVMRLVINMVKAIFKL